MTRTNSKQEEDEGDAVKVMMAKASRGVAGDRWTAATTPRTNSNGGMKMQLARRETGDDEEQGARRRDGVDGVSSKKK